MALDSLQKLWRNKHDFNSVEPSQATISTDIRISCIYFPGMHRSLLLQLELRPMRTPPVPRCPQFVVAFVFNHLSLRCLVVCLLWLVVALLSPLAVRVCIDVTASWALCCNAKRVKKEAEEGVCVCGEVAGATTQSAKHLVAALVCACCTQTQNTQTQTVCHIVPSKELYLCNASAPLRAA